MCGCCVVSCRAVSWSRGLLFDDETHYMSHICYTYLIHELAPVNVSRQQMRHTICPTYVTRISSTNLRVSWSRGLLFEDENSFWCDEQTRMYPKTL